MKPSDCDPEVVCAEALRGLILQDPFRLRLLRAAEDFAAQQKLPDAFLAAGFARNCVWDFLHGLPPTPFNDVDLIYFDFAVAEGWRDEELELALTAQVPDVCWEVKNQARMHCRHNDPAYTSSLDAMRYWPEQQTAVGIRLDGSRRVLSSFALQSLFAGELSVGPYRSSGVLRARAEQKQWLQRWPMLRLQS